MSRCIDGQIGNLLAAYEADMLDDADREKFELHALECRYCNEQIRKFSRGARLMRFDPRVRETIAALDSSPARKKRPTQRIGQAILVAAAVLAFLILKPWQLEFSPTDQAVAAGSRLTVMYFENLADPADTARLGQIATHLLIADLSESQYIDVVSSQRLFDVLKLLGSEDVKSVDRAVATQVAVRADARWMLLGSILQVEPRLELATQLVEVSSGDVIESQRITGSDGEDIFALVDRLSVQVRNDLTLPSEAFQEPDRLVADVTTHSREAYRHYLEGLDNYYKLYIPEAVAGFEKAIEEDSTFAMAYYYLSRLKSRRYVSKAIKYSAAASQKEQAYISVLKASAERDIDRVVAELQQIVERYPDEKEALLQLGRYLASRGRYEEAIGYLDKAVEIDPLYKLSHDLLALCYSGQGDFENAILAIDRYIELAPDEANPYDTRSDIYARSGRLDEAIRSMWGAVRIKRDF
ncbi:MAG: tetratricopeptide repeat protein, partial [bacterium]|nr:tetratricopeptide repeat protein [bacterium]